MSGKRFQARAKTVQKLGRDGLVEQNMATGEEKRVSQRTADKAVGDSPFFKVQRQIYTST